MDGTAKERPKRAASRLRDRHASETALLDAAIGLFAAKGYDAATTRAIANRAGLNEQLITRYFGGKSGLLAAAYNRFIQEEANDDRYAALPSAGSAAEEVEQFLLFKFEHYKRIDTLLRIVFSRLMIDPAVASSMDMAIAGRSRELLSHRLLRLQAQGTIRADVDVGAASLSIICQSLGLYLLMRTTLSSGDDEICEAMRQFGSLVTRGMSGNHPG